MPCIAAGTAASEQFIPQRLSLQRLDAFSLENSLISRPLRRTREPRIRVISQLAVTPLELADCQLIDIYVLIRIIGHTSHQEIPMKPRTLGLKAALLIAMAALPLGVSASTFIVTDDELDADIFPQVADSIRANLDGPNAPRRLSSAEKQQVRKSLDSIEAYLEEDPEGNDFKIRSEQTSVNSVLAPRVARNDGKSEVICKRVRKVGSNIPTTECRTRAEMETDKHLADEFMQRLQLPKKVEGSTGG